MTLQIRCNQIVLSLFLAGICVTMGPRNAGAAPKAQTIASIRAQIDSRALAVAQRRPELARTVTAIKPTRTRNGSSSFSDIRLRDPDAAALLLQRSRSHSDPDFRRAVAAVLPQTGVSTLAALILEQFQIEKSPVVRRALAFALRRATDTAALQAFKRALEDSDELVRVDALDSMRFHSKPELWGELLLPALSDPSDFVRIAAIRAWGSLRNPALRVDILALIKVQNPELRRAALRAFSRVYPSQAPSLVREYGLDRDPDPRTAALARRILK